MRSAHRETGFLDRALRRSDGLHRYVVYTPHQWTRRKKWPVILFLHGAGERGADGLQQTEVGLGPAIRQHSDRFPCLVVFPQCPLGSWWTFPDAEALAMDALDRTVAEFRGDPARTFLTGISMGAYGVWDLAGNFPGVFAALAPICGGIVQPQAVLRAATALSGQIRRGPGTELIDVDETASEPEDAQSAAGLAPNRLKIRERRSPDLYTETALRLAGTPAWVFHGALDPVIPVSESRRLVKALRSAGADVRYTEYPNAGHKSWEDAYCEPELMPWLLSHKLTSTRK